MGVLRFIFGIMFVLVGTKNVSNGLNNVYSGYTSWADFLIAGFHYLVAYLILKPW